MKKNIFGIVSIMFILSLTACGNKPKLSEMTAQETQTEQETIDYNLETETMEEDVQKQQEETSQSENVVSESCNQDGTVDLYVKVLRDYISEGKTNFSVVFIDINDDSTREMAVFFRRIANGWSVFIYS